MASTRITIRLSAALAARLAATTGAHGTLADEVADTAASTADTLAAITTRLRHIEQRLTALEAVADSGRHQQQPRQISYAPPHPSPMLLGTYDPHAATARIQELRRQGWSLTRIAAQLTTEGIPTRYGLPWQYSSVRHLLKTYGKEHEELVQRVGRGRDVVAEGERHPQHGAP
jgi:hypothetical protein